MRTAALFATAGVILSLVMSLLSISAIVVIEWDLGFTLSILEDMLEERIYGYLRLLAFVWLLGFLMGLGIERLCREP